MFSKKAYFFTIDGLVALGILIIGFFLIYSAFLYQPPELQAELFASDLNDFLDKTKIKEFDENHKGFAPIFKLKDIDPERTVIEQAAYYCSEEKKDLAKALAGLSTSQGEIIREQYGFEVLIKNWNPNFEDPNPCVLLRRGNKENQNPDLIITSKDVVYFNKGNEVIGPIIAEVNVWQ